MNMKRDKMLILFLGALMLIPTIPFVSQQVSATGMDDTAAGAIHLSMDEIYYQTIDLDGPDNITGNADDDPIDYYTFTLDYRQNVDISLYVRESDYPTPSLKISLYGPNSSSSLIQEDNSDNSSSSTHYYLSITRTLSAGQYYLVVSSNDQREIQYRVRVDYSQWPTVQAGDTVVNFVAYPDDSIDYYYLPIETPVTLNISLDVPDNMDFDLYLCPDNQSLHTYLKSSTGGRGADELISYSFVTAGNYVIKVKAYSSSSVNEGNYTLSVIMVSDDNKPDLTITSIGPTTAYLNETSTINITVKNIGHQPTASAVSVNAYIDSSTTPVASLTTSGALDPGSEEVVSFQYAFTTVGSHTVSVVADPDNNESELDENNNDMSVQVMVGSADMTADDNPGGANTIALNSTESNFLDKDMDTLDWWKFNVPAAGKIYIEVGWDSNNDIDLYLYNSSDQSNYLTRAYTTNNPEKISNYMLPSAGWYYVKIIPYNDLSGMVNYNITVNYHPGEANDLPSGAEALVPNTVKTGVVSEAIDDIDWYKFSISAAGTADIQLFWADNSDDLYLYLYKPDTSTLVSSSTSSTGNWQSVYEYLDTVGTYYIKIKAQDTESNVSYTLKLNFTAGYTDNYYQAAVPVSVNSSTQGVISDIWDDTDWFKVDLPSAGRIYANVTYPASMSLTVYLYSDPTASSRDSSSANPASTDDTTFQAATYYIKIRTYKAADVAYTLNVTFTTGVPDDYAAGAISVAPNSTTNGTADSSDKNDWYIVNITRQGTLDISLSWTPITYDMDLYLYDDPESSYLDHASSSSANPEQITHNVAPGNYYIKAYLFSSTTTQVQYTLTLTFNPYIPGQGPDLVPNGITPLATTANSSYNFLVDVLNQGPGNAQGNFKVAVYYDGSTTPTTTTIPGLSSSASTQVSFSTSFYSTGIHTVRVVVDKDNDIMEDSETNNEHVYNIHVYPEGHNQLPVPIITSPNSSVNYTTNSIITFNGSASYDPDSLDSMTYLWRSNIDGILGTSMIIQKRLSRGNHTIGLELTDSMGGFNYTEINITVNLAPSNRNPILDIEAPSHPGEISDDNYKIKWNWSDPDGDPCTVDIYYDTDQNSSGGMVQLVAGLDASIRYFDWDLTLVPNGQYYVFMRIKDAQGGMTPVYSNYPLEVHHNLPPSVVFLEPNGKGDDADREFLVEWDATDYEEGHNIVISLYYFEADSPINRTPLIEEGPNTGSYLWDTSNLSAGTYGLYIFASDGKGGTTTVQSSDFVHVEHNQPPEPVTAVRPLTTHQLRPKISWEASSDPEGNLVHYRLELFNATGKIMDKVTYSTTYMIPTALDYGPDGLGQNYTLRITAIDSQGAKSQPLEVNLSTYNHAPQAPMVVIGPDDAKTTDELRVEVRLAEDADGDDLRFRYQWFIDDVLVTSSLVDVYNFVPIDHSVLPPSLTKKGDNIKCIITPWDTFAYGATTTVNITIHNTPPTPVIASPSFRQHFETPAVRMSAAGSSDPDEDNLTYTWTSDIDGYLGTGIDITVTLSPNWHNITLTVSDGEDSETAVTQIKVGMGFVEVTNIKTIPANPMPGEEVKIWVTVTNTGDAVKNSINVSIMIDNQLVSTEGISSLAPGDEKEVSTTWTATSGSHEVYAYIEGNPIINGDSMGSRSAGVGVSEEGEGKSTEALNSPFMTGFMILLAILVIGLLVLFIIHSRRSPEEPEKVVEVQEKLVYVPVHDSALPGGPAHTEAISGPDDEEELPGEAEEQEILPGEKVYSLPGESKDEKKKKEEEEAKRILDELEVPEDDVDEDVEKQLTEEDKEILDIPEDTRDSDEIDEIFN